MKKLRLIWLSPVILKHDALFVIFSPNRVFLLVAENSTNASPKLLDPRTSGFAVSDLDFEKESFGFQVDDVDESSVVVEKHLAVLDVDRSQF